MPTFKRRSNHFTGEGTAIRTFKQAGECSGRGTRKREAGVQSQPGWPPMLSRIRQRPVSVTGDLQTGTKDAESRPPRAEWKGSGLGIPSTLKSFLTLETELPQFNQAFLRPGATGSVPAPPDISQ